LSFKFLYLHRYFLKCFLKSFISKILVFSQTWAIISLFLGSYFCETSSLWSFWSSSVVTFNLPYATLLFRGVFALCIGFVPTSCVEVYWLCALLFCRGMFSLWSFFFIKIVKILLGEGSDVEQVTRTSKHILVFVFGYLLTQLYFYLYLALLLVLIHVYLILCLHLFWSKWAIETPHLL